MTTLEKEDFSPSGPKQVLGVSAMAQLIRAEDWKDTPLGTFLGWSSEFLAVVNAALSSPVPMFLYCGEECVTIYNDAAIPFVSGKHPVASEAYASDLFAEAWHIVGPEIRAVLEAGSTTGHQGVLVPLLLDGQLQNLYWDYSYSPLFERTRLQAYSASARM